MSSLSEQATNLLALIPETGSIGNVTLRKNLRNSGSDLVAEDFVDEIFAATKAELLAAGLIKLGRGKGGSVKRVLAPVSVEEHTDFVREVAGVSPVSEQLATGQEILEAVGNLAKIQEEF